MGEAQLNDLWAMSVASDDEAMRLKKSFAVHGVFAKQTSCTETLQAMDIFDTGPRQHALKNDIVTSYIRCRDSEGNVWGLWQPHRFDVLK
jgi:hypothetical protein